MQNLGAIAQPNITPLIEKRKTEINDLISGGTGSDELGSIGGSLHGILFLAVEIQDSLIHGVDNAGDGSTGEEVMVEVGRLPLNCNGSFSGSIPNRSFVFCSNLSRVSQISKLAHN